MSKFDLIYRRLLLTKFFTKGWGKPDDLKRIFEFRKIISNREKCKHLVSPDYPIYIDKDITAGDCRQIDGHFISPFTTFLPGIMPKEVEIARFQAILPKKWKSDLKPVCIHLAGTGDHYFWRRRMLLARPLLKEAGIASILLENPYYGTRKPKGQLRSSLHNVSDLFVMGGALVVESLALLHWCERQGYGPLGLTGISMGGHMASLASTNWDKPHVLVPCLSWSTASQVFTRGVMSGAIPWSLLEEQYLMDSIYHDQIQKLIISPEDLCNGGAFQLGREFVQSFPETEQELKKFDGLYEPGQSSVGHPDLNFVNSDKLKDHSDLKNPVTCEHNLDLEQVMSKSVKNVLNLKTLPNRTNSKTREQHPDNNIKEEIGGKTKFENQDNVHSVNSFKPARTKAKNMKEKCRQDLKKEALNFMRGVMDECTHLGNFSIPVDPNLIIIVAAKKDAYIPRDNVLSLLELWPGSEVRYIDSGHIGAFLFNQTHFRKAIIDAFDRQIKKYYT